MNGATDSTIVLGSTIAVALDPTVGAAAKLPSEMRCLLRADYRKIAGNKGAVKDFYNKITRLVIMKYGCDLPVDKDADEELPDPDEAALNEVDEYDGDEEEQERRDAFRRDLHRKIAAWYPGQIRRFPRESATSSASNDTFTSLLEEIVQPPRRQQVIQQFSKLHWADKIAPHYELLKKKGATATAAAREEEGEDDEDEYHDGENSENSENSDDSDKASDKASDKNKDVDGKGSSATGGRGRDVHLRMRAIREVWAAESDEVKAEMAALVESTYNAEMEDYRMKFLDMPETDEDREWSSAHAYVFLQPIVDMVAARFNCAASLFIAGPVPSKDGHVERARGEKGRGHRRTLAAV
ncbi:hypothetical protein FA95DRAFT_1574523 [Auriscalpium vulgare]|uniref:Uncharacterized protein n=1 Tax=Auriscalpium vulgare TaxID=40419 RepID=A0ACB8RK83_9AGAM|nr:hypothetical protein FA95DRAFT_1574523 [Auriscalpium vulgare]